MVSPKERVGIHMRKNYWITRLVILMLASYALLVVSVTAAGSAGSEGDPLVTLSYLNETFMTQLMGRLDEKLEQRDKELSDKLAAQVAEDTRRLSEQYGVNTGGSSGTTDVFTVVTLSNGQVLRGTIGCEVMLRVGTANCVASSEPGLIDETDASTLSGGKALVKNHLYMMTIDDRGVKATAETIKLLVRGSYTIT